jgi:hypothetical protein
MSIKAAPVSNLQKGQAFDFLKIFAKNNTHFVVNGGKQKWEIWPL